jgi:hypothetical protein
VNNGLAYCADGGLLVGSDLPIPSDPRVRRTDGERVGCNRITCDRCGCPVRQVEGRRLARFLTPEEIEALYTDPDPRGSAALSVAADGEAFRTYVCRCSVADVAGMRFIVDVEVGAWRCSGHPTAAAMQTRACLNQ